MPGSHEQRSGTWSLGSGRDQCNSLCLSANDAVLAAGPGVKATGRDHRDAVRLLESRLKDEDAQSAAKRLDVIISKKSRVEYEQKRLSEKEARELVLDVERFFSWAKTRMPTNVKL